MKHEENFQTIISSLIHISIILLHPNSIIVFQICVYGTSVEYIYNRYLCDSYIPIQLCRVIDYNSLNDFILVHHQSHENKKSNAHPSPKNMSCRWDMNGLSGVRLMLVSH